MLDAQHCDMVVNGIARESHALCHLGTSEVPLLQQFENLERFLVQLCSHHASTL